MTRLVPAMKDRRWNRVIMIRSFLGLMPEPFAAVYAATRMANESVRPAWKPEPGHRSRCRAAPQQAELPAGRIGAPTDVADTAALLASTRSGFVTSTNVRVDGGMMPTVNEQRLETAARKGARHRLSSTTSDGVAELRWLQSASARDAATACGRVGVCRNPRWRLLQRRIGL